MIRRSLLLLCLCFTACGGAIDHPAGVESVSKEASVEGTSDWAIEQFNAGQHLRMHDWSQPTTAYIVKEGSYYVRRGVGWKFFELGKKYDVIPGSTGWELATA